MICRMEHFSPDSLRIDAYTYTLPDSMIARFPLLNRAASKLLIYDRGDINQTTFHNIAEYTGSDDLMIFNNTRVIPARILMSKDTGAKIEIFLLEPLSPAEYNLAFSSSSGCRWKCMTGNKKRWKSDKLSRNLVIDGKSTTLSVRIVNDNDLWQEIEFMWDPEHLPFSLVLDKAGLPPIPPYLDRMPVKSDKVNYQTVFSRIEGSVAAPTAGLHFTTGILEELKKKGTILEEITLHVGAGTFRPVKSITAGGHPMHAEHFSVSLEAIEKLRIKQGKITAVGTTSVRSLESIYWLGVKQILNKNIKHPFLLNQWEHLQLPQDIQVREALDAIAGRLAQEGVNKLEAKTEMMIIPGYKFRITNRMITNFHQPGSTLLLLIAAFVGQDWQKVYNYALKNNFRFLSYGDSSLLIPGISKR